MKFALYAFGLCVPFSSGVDTQPGGIEKADSSAALSLKSLRPEVHFIRTTPSYTAPTTSPSSSFIAYLNRGGSVPGKQYVYLQAV